MNEGKAMTAATERARAAWANCTHDRGQPPCISCIVKQIIAAEQAAYALAVAAAAAKAWDVIGEYAPDGTLHDLQEIVNTAIRTPALSAGASLPTTPCPRCDNMILFEKCCESGCQRPAPSLDVAGVQRVVAGLESAKCVSSETMRLCVGDPPSAASPGYAEGFAAGAWQRMKLAVIDVLHNEFNKMPYSASQAVFVETVSAAVRALPLPTPERTP